MKTEQISLVLAIARERSVSKAADALFISQPTASNMLKSLETELGYPLFERTRTGMIPTKEGSAFIEYAGHIERSLQAISQIPRAEKRVDFKVLSIGFEFTEMAFKKLCEKYSMSNERVELYYQIVHSAEETVKAVEAGGSDLGILLCRKNMYEAVVRSTDKKQLEAIPIGDMQLNLTCRRSHPIFADGETINYSLISRYPSFSSIPIADAELYIPDSLIKQGFDVRKRIVMDHSVVRYRLLKALDGYLISIPLTEEVKKKYDLESRPVPDTEMTAFAICHKNSLKEDLINEYVDYCRTILQNMD